MTDETTQDEVQRLREALGFYANPGTYEEGAPEDGGPDGIVPINCDNGSLAREALGTDGIVLERPL